jgi:hypothetical protein
MLRCRLCGSTLIAELQKGNTYYRCHTRECDTKTLREEKIDRALADAFAPLRLSKEEIVCAQRWFARARTNQSDWQKQELERCHLSLAQLRDRLMRLTDAYLEGVLDKSILEERRSGLLLEEAGLKQKIADLEAGHSGTLTRAEEFLELIKAASNLHRLAIAGEKRTLAKKLTSNLGAGPKSVAIALNADAQEIANRSELLCSSPNRGVHRTWDRLLTHLVKSLDGRQAA